MSTSDSTLLGNAIEFTGRQDNTAVREAAMLGLGATLVMALIALSSIILFVPNDAGSKKSDTAPTKATELLAAAEEDIAAAEEKIAKAQEEARLARKRYKEAQEALAHE